MTTTAYILIFGLLGSLTASVMYGLYWAIRQGQFSNFERGATSIFDEEEPMGFRTDAYPGEASAPRGAQSRVSSLASNSATLGGEATAPKGARSHSPGQRPGSGKPQETKP